MLISDTEPIRGLLEKLNETAKSGAVLVVEGKQDAAALKPLVNADFFLLQDKGKSLYESAEQIAALTERAILLLDADHKGRQLATKMTTYLRNNGVAVDNSIGQRLLKAARQRTIQGLKRIIQKISDVV